MDVRFCDVRGLLRRRNFLLMIEPLAQFGGNAREAHDVNAHVTPSRRGSDHYRGAAAPRTPQLTADA
jgi:hypothetical protein